jgi:hypothetical protein
MDSVEIELLEACQEVVCRQQEMLPLLASTLGVPAEEVFYTWAFRKCAQRGKLSKDPWGYFFHGLECDLTNGADGRFLRIDFGPGGRVDTLTAWGVYQFVMTSSAPWSDFPSLRQQFAPREPPYDRFSGDFYRLCDIWDRLKSQGCFEPADPELVRFREQFTSVGSDGIRHVSFPAGTPEKKQVDCSVAGRSVLTARAHQLLASHVKNRFLERAK